MRHRITHIRQSTNTTKLKWLVGLSALATVIVIVFWVMYMNAFVFIGSGPDTKEDVRIGFWPVFKNGLTITGSSIGNAFGNILSGIPTFGRHTTTIRNPE